MSAPDSPPTRPSRLRQCLWRLVVLLALAAVLYAFRFPLMRGAAQAWIVGDPLLPADAVVVLGGGLDSRPFVAAEFHKRGLAPIVLLSAPEINPVAAMGLVKAEDVLAEEILHQLGVPKEAVQRFGGAMTSTRDEALAVRRWIEQHPVKRLIIPTDAFCTRRVRHIFREALDGLGTEINVVAIPNKRYDPLEWWRSEEAVICFQNEVAKFLYHLIRY